jgi:hypothetical protein
MPRILADTPGHRGKVIILARSLQVPAGLVASRPGGPAWSVKRRRARSRAYRGMRGQANRAANAWSGPAGGSHPPITSRQARARTDRGSGAQRDAPAPASTIARAERHPASPPGWSRSARCSTPHQPASDLCITLVSVVRQSVAREKRGRVLGWPAIEFWRPLVSRGRIGRARGRAHVQEL